MPQILTTTIRFPEIQLQTRDAHKLRGYFGEYFKEHSPLLHNHYEDGSSRYKYPLVQYKVIDQVPVLVGFQEGADLLTSLFLKIKELNIEGKSFPIFSKNISHEQVEIGVIDDLIGYTFCNHWMALNSENHKTYLKSNPEEQHLMLNQILRGNILSFFKGVNVWLDDKIMVKGNFRPKTSKFKDQKMIVFQGDFVSNIALPNFVGVGKSVARGFGAIKKTH
ncbi:CRISPR-associated endonuclease Cas6 [Belliella marina]|uniref:CRISPR-associated endonuclease Cas6 n=1 Tax=Belliella marina TaxID=1644146 RepID=A0ABW4VXD3_9BACT